jgi:hypothetical protein
LCGGIGRWQGKSLVLHHARVSTLYISARTSHCACDGEHLGSCAAANCRNIESLHVRSAVKMSHVGFFERNKSAQTLTLVTCIRKVTASSLNRYTNNSDWNVSWISSVPAADFPVALRTRTWFPPPTPFSSNYSLTSSTDPRNFITCLLLAEPSLFL